MITIAVVEDNRLVRESITAMLNKLSDMEVVLSSMTFDAESLKAADPRVVLLAVKATRCLRLAAGLSRTMSRTNVIVMDLVPAQDEIAELVNAGVAGFVLKDATFDDLVGSIRTVANGARVLPPQMTGTLFSQIAALPMGGNARTSALDAVRMTAREHEVIALIAVGLSNKEIAKQLNISTDTAKSHVRNVMDKLAVRSRLQIAAYAHARPD